LSNPNTTVSVDAFGQTHFIFIYGDSTLDLVYSNLPFCNGYFMGSLSGTLFEAGIPLNQYIAPIASLVDDILASLIDFVTNNPANLDGSQQSIQTTTYQLIEGCNLCSNCSPRILGDNGDPGDNGPGGSGGGTGWYEDDYYCLAPEILSPTPGYTLFLCPGQCNTIPLVISEPNASVIAMSGMGSLQVIVNGNSVEICNYNNCSNFEQVTLVASNQCGQSSTTIFIQSQPGWINAYPYTQDICSGTNANINVNSQGGCGFTSNSISYNIIIPSGVTTDYNLFGNLMPWTPFSPNFINTTSSPQIVYIDFYQYCGGNLQQAQVVVYPTPIVNAGVDQSICSNSPISLNGTIGGGATSAYWTTSGSGTFANSSSVTTTYTPSQADVNAGTVTLTLIANDAIGLCSSVSDQLVVSFGSSAAVNAGADQAICSNSIITLTGSISGSTTSATWTSSGSGTFANASSLTTTYIPSSADINAGSVVLTLTTNDPVGPCSLTNDQLVLTFGSSPTVEAGNNQSTCSNIPVNLNGTINGSATANWTSSGTGTFASETNLNTTYTPSNEDMNSGSIILTLTGNDASGVCPSISDQVLISLINAPQNPQVIVTNNSISTDSYPNTSYQWVRCPGYLPISGFTSSTFNSSSYSGGLAVIVTNECGSDTSDCVNVNLSSVAELSGDILEIYPNPTNENTTIEVSENLIGKEFKLQDFAGRVVINGQIDSNKTQLILSNLAPGTYYLKVEDCPISRKIIKK
jgi:hypothetical protein